MHPNVERRARRVHGAEIKSKVLAECRKPGASVSAVALANGLNANLVRRWLQGRGLQRAGLKAEAAQAADVMSPRPGESSPARLQFVPVTAVPGKPIDAAPTPWKPAGSAQPGEAVIHIDLRHGSGQVTVRWPAMQASECALWLREITAAVLK